MIETAILYSGGYESTLAEFMYPRAERVFIDNGKNPYLTTEMQLRGVTIIKNNCEVGLGNTGVSLLINSGYKKIILGYEYGSSWNNSCGLEDLEDSARYWEGVEETNPGVSIIFACGCLNHTEVIKRVLKVRDKCDILTCDNWTPLKPRCGECYNCRVERKYLMEEQE